MPNITIAEYNALKRDAKRLNEFRDQQTLAPLIEKFKTNLATLAASEPIENWPHWFKIAFEDAERELPYAGALYRELANHNG